MVLECVSAYALNVGDAFFLKLFRGKDDKLEVGSCDSKQFLAEPLSGCVLGLALDHGCEVFQGRALAKVCTCHEDQSHGDGLVAMDAEVVAMVDVRDKGVYDFLDSPKVVRVALELAGDQVYKLSKVFVTGIVLALDVALGAQLGLGLHHLKDTHGDG